MKKGKKILYVADLILMFCVLGAVLFSFGRVMSTTYPNFSNSIGRFVSGHGMSLSYTRIAPIPEIYDGITENGGDKDVTKLIANIFKVGVGLCTAFAVLMIIYGGFKYISSEGFGAASDAKDIITHALGGLLLALSIYLILFSVNKSLLNANFFTDLTPATITISNATIPPSPILGNGLLNSNTTNTSGIQVITNPTNNPTTPTNPGNTANPTNNQTPLPPGQGGSSNTGQPGTLVSDVLTSGSYDTSNLTAGNQVYSARNTTNSAFSDDTDQSQWLLVSNPAQSGDIFLVTNTNTGQSIYVPGRYYSSDHLETLPGAAPSVPYQPSRGTVGAIGGNGGDGLSYTVSTVVQKPDSPPTSGSGN